MRLGMFKNPVLRFGEGTASSPYEGFKMGLKPFKRVPKICMEVVYRRDYRREARNLVLKVIGVSANSSAQRWSIGILL